MAKITMTSGSDDYQAKGCRWIDLAFPDTVWEVDRVWKNAIEMHSVTTGTTMRASKRQGMTAANGWHPLKGDLFKHSFALELAVGRPLASNVAICKDLAARCRDSL